MVDFGGHLIFSTGELKIFEIVDYSEEDGKLKLICYRRKPPDKIERQGFHAWVLDGKLERGGTYIGLFQNRHTDAKVKNGNVTLKEIPLNEAVPFSLKQAQPDIYTGRYDLKDIVLEVVLRERNLIYFELYNNSFDVEGEAKLTGNHFHLGREIDGQPIYIDFQFLESKTCRVDTNLLTPSTKKLHIPWFHVSYHHPNLGNFSGLYKEHLYKTHTGILKPEVKQPETHY
jgi:hypothetical protein